MFGRVVEGMEVVDRISVSPTGAQGPFKQDAPLQPVVIQKIELLDRCDDRRAAAPPCRHRTRGAADAAAGRAARRRSAGRGDAAGRTRRE